MEPPKFTPFVNVTLRDLIGHMTSESGVMRKPIGVLRTTLRRTAEAEMLYAKSRQSSSSTDLARAVHASLRGGLEPIGPRRSNPMITAEPVPSTRSAMRETRQVGRSVVGTGCPATPDTARLHSEHDAVTAQGTTPPPWAAGNVGCTERGPGDLAEAGGADAAEMLGRSVRSQGGYRQASWAGSAGLLREVENLLLTLSDWTKRNHDDNIA